MALAEMALSYFVAKRQGGPASAAERVREPPTSAPMAIGGEAAVGLGAAWDRARAMAAAAAW